MRNNKKSVNAFKKNINYPLLFCEMKDKDVSKVSKYTFIEKNKHYTIN